MSMAAVPVAFRGGGSVARLLIEDHVGSVAPLGGGGWRPGALYSERSLVMLPTSSGVIGGGGGTRPSEVSWPHGPDSCMLAAAQCCISWAPEGVPGGCAKGGAGTRTSAGNCGAGAWKGAIVGVWGICIVPGMWALCPGSCTVSSPPKLSSVGGGPWGVPLLGGWTFGGAGAAKGPKPDRRT